VRLSRESHPEELLVEASSICNMNCLHCSRKASRDLEPRYTNLNLFRTLLVEASDIGVKKIVFLVGVSLLQLFWVLYWFLRVYVNCFILLL